MVMQIVIIYNFTENKTALNNFCRNRITWADLSIFTPLDCFKSSKIIWLGKNIVDKGSKKLRMRINGHDNGDNCIFTITVLR